MRPAFFVFGCRPPLSRPKEGAVICPLWKKEMFTVLTYEKLTKF